MTIFKIKFYMNKTKEVSSYLFKWGNSYYSKNSYYSQ